MNITTTPNTGAETTLHAATDDLAPTVRHLDINGVPCVAVQLYGRHGYDKEMLLDEADLQATLAITPYWAVSKLGSGLYVTSGAAKAAEIAQQSAKIKMLVLARHIAKPGPGEFVRYADGNPLNLTRQNLKVVSRSAHSRQNVRTRLENTMRREAAARAALAANAAAAAVVA